MGIFSFFDRKRLEPRVLSWQQRNGCHFVSFVMYNSGAKFKEHHSNISRNILDSVLYCFGGNNLWNHHCPNLHNTKTSVSLKWNKIFWNGKCHSSLFWKAFQISNTIFHFTGTLIEGNNFPAYILTMISNAYLHNKCSSHDNKKHRVMGDASKNISLPMYFTRVDFIEELHHDKCIEHYTWMNCGLTACRF